jgi:hypothetical protein
MFRAIAKATSDDPRTTKNAIVLRRLVINIEKRKSPQEVYSRGL